MSADHVYHHTVFQALPEELPSSPFHIITAWNPEGQTDLPGRNRERDLALARRLDSLGVTGVRITGMSPDESHAEPGWAIGVPREQALKLGREFRQESFYQVRDDSLHLVPCGEGETIALGPFTPRLRDPRRRRLFTVHIGSPSPRARFLPTEELEIRLRIAKRFPSFTLAVAEGCFHSQTEDVLWIGVATEEPEEVVALAEDLREHLQQESIGLSCKGIYQLVTAWSDRDLLLRAWGFAASEQVGSRS